MKNFNFSFLWLAIAIISFSSYEVVSKTVVGYIDPSQLTFVRYLIGGLVLIPFAFLNLKKQNLSVSIKDMVWMAVLGTLMVVISMNMIQIGYQYTSANLSAIIISANPIFVAMISSMVLKESLSIKKTIGLTVGIIGVLIAVGGTGDMAQEHLIYGVSLQVLGMIAFSFYTVFGKKTSQKLGSVTMTAFTNLFGAFAMLPVLFFMNIQPFAFELSPIWIQMLYICIGNTGIAFFLYFKALQSIDTSLGAMSFLIKPFLASIIAAVFLGEVISLQLIIGILFVAAGIYLVLLSTKKSVSKKCPADKSYEKASETV